MQINVISDPFDLQHLAASIRNPSNFRFAWQFFSVSASDLDSIGTVAEILDVIVTQPGLHSFLANSLDEIYPREFQIAPLHKHASIVRDGAAFLDTLSRASLDRYLPTNKLGHIYRFIEEGQFEQRSARHLHGKLAPVWHAGASSFARLPAKLHVARLPNQSAR